MATIDLRELPPNDLVLHFGGRVGEIDALTFSNALIGLAEAIQEINRQVNPGVALEVTIDGVGPGSFRAHLKSRAKVLAGLLKKFSKELVIALLVSYVMEKSGGDKIKIEVNEDVVVIQHGSDRIIMPKEVWQAQWSMPHKERVDRHIAKAFSAMEADSSVTGFGFARNLNDEKPLALIPREDFFRLSSPIAVDDGDTKVTDEESDLTVMKAVFQRGNRKWEFIWKGIRISAPITDPTFFDRLANREFSFAQGDQIHTILRIHQRRDELSGVFVNEWYEVIAVLGETRRPRQPDLGL